jgi:addiction module HigA family antidote
MAIQRTGQPNWQIHPGVILREEFLKPMELTPNRLAKELRVSAPTVNEIVRERRAISAEMAVLLARFFNTSEQFWLNLQAAYDVGRAKKKLAAKVKQVKPLAKNRLA